MSLLQMLTAQPMAIEPTAFRSLLLAAWRADQKGITPDKIQTQQPQRMTMVGSTAVLPLTGLMFPEANFVTRYFGGTSTQQLEQDVYAALDDSRVKRIALLVNSPGGSALGNEELARTIYDARGGKPIVAAIRGMAASAAYYVASAAERMIATPSSPVGSIGVILYHAEFAKALEEAGITVNVIRHGENKGDGNQLEGLSKRARANLQEFVDAYGDQFDAAVARQRGVSVAAVRSRFGQGKVYLAEEAESRGLIDEVGSLESALAGEVAAADDEEMEDEEMAAWSANIVLPETWSANIVFPWNIDQLSAVSGQPTAESRPLNTEARAPGGATTPLTEEEPNEMEMTKNLKAALYFFGALQVADVEKAQAASDDVCWAALNAWFAARGQEVPEGDDKIIAALKQGGDKPTAQASGTADPTPAPKPPAETVDENQVRADERERMKNIRASGRLLGIDDEKIEEAINSQQSYGDILSAWHAAKAEEEPPVATPDISFGASGAEKFHEAAAAVLFDRCCGGIAAAASEHFPHSGAASAGPEEGQKPAGYAELQHAPLSFIAEQSLRLSGRRVPQFASKEQIALAALQSGGYGVSEFHSELYAAGPALNRPGDFPNLLSNLAGKMLDMALQLADPTYPIYTQRLMDKPDFKPTTVIQTGQFEELDLVLDGKKADEQAMLEEAGGWLQIDRYANKVALTPVMVANDDLDNFTRQLASLSYAHEQTLNRLCVSLLTSNVTLLDGNSLYDNTNHGNDVTSGASPSATQATTHRQKHLLQTGVGDRGKVRTPPSIWLGPVELQEDAEQVFLTSGAILEAMMKRPQTDATINVHRGKITPVVEPELSDNSTKIWYTFADPRIRPVIAHAFMSGYGRGGRRTTWFDPDSECRYVKLEGRFAAAAISHRGSVRNAGE